jgi:hypothetical protein
MQAVPHRRSRNWPAAFSGGRWLEIGVVEHFLPDRPNLSPQQLDQNAVTG